MSSELTYSAFESRYRDKQYIGSGGFAKVYKVFDHAKNHYVALKVADVRPEWDKFTLRNEVELVNKLPRHRNIARYDACYRFNTGFTGEMDFAVLRFYEYGNLEQFLLKQEISLEDKRLIIQGILDGIAFLHRKNVIHRDMKSQNILLHREDGVWTPKITDFGLSREILGDANITNSAIGLSYAYAAPEQIQNKKIYKNVDLWAVGIIAYRIIANELPFKGRVGGDSKSTQSQLELSRKIINLELPEKLNTLPEPYQTLIRRCLVLDPMERAQTAEDLIQCLNGDNPLVNSEPVSFVAPIEVEEPKPEAPIAVPEAIDPPENIEPRPEVVDQDSTELITNPAPEEAVTPEVITPLPEVSAPVNPYNPPKTNFAQDFKDEKPKEAKNPSIKPYKSNTSDTKKGFNGLWLIIPLLLLVGSIGAWMFLQEEAPTKKENTEFISKEERVVKKEVDRFETTDEENEKASKQGRRALDKFSETIQLLIDDAENKDNYRPHYLMAKNRAYRGGAYNRKAISALIESAKVAVRTGTAGLMLKDIEQDKAGAFEKLMRINQGKDWNDIITALDRSNK